MSPTVALPSEEEIATLMQQFYLKVERDEELGPIFAPVLGDPSSHVDEMTDFWTAALRSSALQDNGPVARSHAPHPIAPLGFARWLSLFRATASDVLGPIRGRRFLEAAERIADDLQMTAPPSRTPPAGPQKRPPTRQRYMP